MAAPTIDPFEHVIDSSHIEIFPSIHWAIHLPKIFGFQITKFMVLELLAAVIILLIYLPVARRVSAGGPPQGKLTNAAEFILSFIRDQVARPAIGEHDYRRYLPLLWTLFLFILVCDLLGMIPFLGSPTASLAVTMVLAIISFIVIHYNGVIANHGVKNYLKSFVPHIEGDDPVLKIMKPFIMVGMFFLEILGAIIRGFVLAVRLFANMLAGHTVLFVMLLFIRMIGFAAYESSTADTLFWPITLASVGLATTLSVLELFVACLQAFVFTFLTAVFIGMAMHPQH